ncbi:hypothetical protein D4M24_19255 [Escherichia coli]|nr:hypothetical protein D4M24_19255 [Escherichia coli]
MFACTFFFLHGAGCLPVNSVSAPESAIIVIYTVALRSSWGVHHTEFFNKRSACQMAFQLPEL